jgi:hypothetical protein
VSVSATVALGEISERVDQRLLERSVVIAALTYTS